MSTVLICGKGGAASTKEAADGEESAGGGERSGHFYGGRLFDSFLVSSVLRGSVGARGARSLRNAGDLCPRIF